MRVRKFVVRFVIAAYVVGAVVVVGLSDWVNAPEVTPKGGVQAPHSIFVDVPQPGMLPGYLCASPIKSSDCPEDTKGWEGSSEDDRVKA